MSEPHDPVWRVRYLVDSAWPKPLREMQIVGGNILGVIQSMRDEYGIPQYAIVAVECLDSDLNP